MRHNRKTMSDPLHAVAERFAQAFATVAGDIADPVVRPSDHADAQINGALGVAKKLGTNPRQVAEQVLVAAGDVSDMCSSLEIAGPGFINVTLSNEFLSTQLQSAMNDTHLGVRVAPTRLTAAVDYSAPNVAKEMHVGHLRSTVIGDCIVRLLEFVGHTVIRENHIGDWGTPFGMLIEHLIDMGQDTAAQELGVGDLDGFYRAARNAFDSDDAFKDRARARVVLLQSGDAETLHLWRTLLSESTLYFNHVYRLLDVLLTDADIMGESSYNDLLAPVVERLRKAKLLEVSDGADVVFPAGFTNRDGDPLPLIIRKGDGGYNYATSDLACVIDRTERLDASLLIYVVGAPQAQHLSMVAAVAAQAGWLTPPAHMVHVAFGNVLGDDGKMLKSRAGDTVKLAALLEEAVERAAKAIAQKNPDMPEQERAQVAHMIGIGAVKYSDLSTDRVKDYVFDWERMLSFDGNTAPYLQYAHARMCSIFRRAGIERESVRSVSPIILEPREHALAIRMLQFDSAVWDALEKYSPHRLCTYLYELATDFTAFYEHCPVLKADTEEQRLSRLALCDSAARVLERGLNLLGIRAPEQM